MGGRGGTLRSQRLEESGGESLLLEKTEVTWTPGDPPERSGMSSETEQLDAGDQEFVLPLLFQHLFFKSEASAGEAAGPAFKLSEIQDNPNLNKV